MLTKLYYYHAPMDSWLHIETLPIQKALSRLKMFNGQGKKAVAVINGSK